MQVFLQLDSQAKKDLEATQKELGALKAAVASAGEDATLDQACSGQLKQSVLQLYTKNASIKVSLLGLNPRHGTPYAGWLPPQQQACTVSIHEVRERERTLFINQACSGQLKQSLLQLYTKKAIIKVSLIQQSGQAHPLNGISGCGLHRSFTRHGLQRAAQAQRVSTQHQKTPTLR